MTKIQKSYRLEERQIEAVKEYADRHGITQTEAIAQIIENGIRDRETEPKAEPVAEDTGSEILEVLKREVDTLEDQIRKKDRLIDSLTDQITDLQALTKAVTAIAGQAQQLHAISEHRALNGPEEVQEAPTADQEETEGPVRKKGFFRRLFDR